MLAAVIGIGIGLAGMAGPVAAGDSDSDKVRELEARISQLEAMVAELIGREQAEAGQTARSAEPVQDAQPVQPVQPTLPATTTPGSTAPVVAATAPPAPAATAPMASADTGTRLRWGGFIKADTLYTVTSDGPIADGTAGRQFHLPQSIPVGVAEGSERYLDSHAQYSRFWLAADTTLASGEELRAWLEFDLSGTALGNEAATNTYGLALRHAWLSWRGWLAGQTWSNFQDAGVLPDTVDFIGATEGTVFARQSQLRYSRGPWSLSLENPETLVTPYQGGGARIVTGDNHLPDATVRYVHRADWGHVGMAGLLRSLRYRDAALDIGDSRTGYGLSLSGRINLGERDNLRFMLSGGEGINRYIGIAASTDAVLDAAGELQPLDVVAGFIAWQHLFNDRYRGNLFYSRADYGNDAQLTGLGITRRLESLHGNLIWTVLPKLELGLEAIWARRLLERGDSGEQQRLHFHAKYSF
ncbi:MAG: DcaP family trimeric outer membrane transporter [Xanthomonadales bacterium]|nr:DcaP family trimeric outer membrane transporter [Xanthomonadales bacterium]